MFVDRVTLSLSAGRGGNGVIAWRREKFIPKGGPAGGDGGRGGSIYLLADPQLRSLEDYRNRRIIKAQNGASGAGNNRTGKNGQDLHLKVPLGTLVKDTISQEILYDFTEEGQTWKICAGGLGGKGNSRFKSSTHQAPFYCTEGKPGESREIELELKLIADIGLVGMPNAGKSTLLSQLTHVAVKIAPYPFTTLRPNLGMIALDDTLHLLLADIPGLIEKASEDRGLGIEFLKHIERTSILVFVIELAPHQERDAYEEFLMLRRELCAYDPSLLEKPYLIALNKIDQEGAAELAMAFHQRFGRDTDNILFEISAQEGTNIEEFKRALYPSLLKTGRFGQLENPRGF